MTGGMGLAVRRAAAGRGPLLALALLTALVVACVVGVLGQVERGVDLAVREASELTGEGTYLALRTRLLDDARAQDVTVDALVAAAVGAARVEVARTETPDGTDTPFVAWTLSVDPAELGPEDVAALAAGLPGLEGAVKASDATSRGVVATGRLVTAVAGVADRVTALRQVAIVPLLVLVVVGAVGLGRLAHQVVAGRRGEDALLAARGVSRRQMLLLAAGEALVVTAVGAAVGAGTGLALLPALGVEPRALVGGVAAVAAGAVVVGALTVTALAGRQLDDLLRRAPRGTLAAGPVVVAVVLGGLGLLAAWRIVVARGAAAPDLLAVLAPGVLLVVLVLLAVQASGPALAHLARRAARGRALDRVLALRSAARRPGVRLPALVVGLAVGTLVLAAVLAGTSVDAGARRATLDAGADLRVRVALSGPLTGSDVDVAPGLAADAVAATPVVVREGNVGADAVTVLAASARDLDAVVRGEKPVAPLLVGGVTAPTAPEPLDPATVDPDAPAPSVAGIIDDDLATSLAVGVGGNVPVTIAGATLDVRVVEVRDRLPGATSPAALVDVDAARAALVAVGAAPMASEEVWLRTGATPEDAPAAARRLAAHLAEDGAWGVPADAYTAVLAPRGTEPVPAFWTAALATVVLALAGLRATTHAQARSREGETVALRALGIGPARQGRLRARETWLVIGAGAIGGCVAGALVAVVATPLLVAAATGATSSVPLTADVLPLVGGLVVLGAGASVLVGLHARTVARQAADLDLREVSA